MSEPRVRVAQLDRASASEAEGCRFEPRRGYLSVKGLRSRGPGDSEKWHKSGTLCLTCPLKISL